MSDAPLSTIDQEAMQRLAIMEARLADLQRQLDHTLRLATIGTIAAGVAHEVNNALTPALAYAQLARAQPHDPELLGKAVTRIASGIESATRILQAMLDFSSPSDRASIADVGATLQATLDLIGRAPAKDGITLVRRIEPGAFVAIQPLALQQVLSNLLLNARRVLRGRGGEIVVEAREVGDGLISITVADNGPGIPPQIADSLFEPFVSFPVAGSAKEAGRADAQAGSGLGLAVCRRIIESAGGRISAESAPGGGAACDQSGRITTSSGSIVRCTVSPARAKRRGFSSRLLSTVPSASSMRCWASSPR
jgi:two-component system NtrC family sensor kinase